MNLFSTLYYHALKSREQGSTEWAALSYDCYATQALPEKEIERLRAELTDNKFRQEMLCDFTASADDSLITLDEVNAAFARNADPRIVASWPLVLGVDIARFGSDSTVFFPRLGPLACKPLVLRKKSNTDVAHRLLAYIEEEKPAIVAIDQGQGTGVIDIARDMAPAGVAIHEIPFGSKALEDKKYFNRRAEIWHKMAQWLKGGGCLPQEANLKKILLAELSSPVYSFDAQGRIRLEAKEEIKKRLNHSTDLGDALALTFALPVSPLGADLRKKARQRKKIYDPFA